MMTKKTTSGFACMECDRKFRTVSAANRAFREGCPKCGGVDIDIAVDGTQGVLFSGLKCLPGQLDLFETDGKEK